MWDTTVSIPSFPITTTISSKAKLTWGSFAKPFQLCQAWVIPRSKPLDRTSPVPLSLTTIMSSKASKKAKAKARQALRLDSAWASLQSSCCSTPASSCPPSPPAFPSSAEDAEADLFAATASQAFFQSEIVGSYGDDTPTTFLFPVLTDTPPDNMTAFVATEKDWNMAQLITVQLQATGPLSSL